MKHSTMSITSYSCKWENLHLNNIRVVVILYDGLLAQITVYRTPRRIQKGKSAKTDKTDKKLNHLNQRNN